ncbi:Receptor-like cytosolic serine/threonine-protein kinase RBK2 [Linum perenne]
MQVNLEIKLTFGCCPLKITVEQARKSNPRWIVLDSNWKKYKTIIYSKVGCSIAVMKGKDLATLIPSRNGQTGISTVVSCRNRSELDVTDDGESSSSSASRHSSESARESSGWYPLSWRSGFPRAFSLTDLEVMTNGFSKDNIVPHGPDDIRIYEGVFQQTPILIRSFVENDERFWTALTILSRIRHKNIMNLVGYCCYENSTFLLFDNPCMGSLEINLRVDDMARKLSWKARWNIALETGGSLQYLHEECATDGAIVHLSVCSSHVSLCYGSITMLAYFATARFLKDEREGTDDCQTQMGRNEEHDELIAVDIHDYGVLLIELVSGMSARLFQRQGVGQSLVDWAMPLLENGSIDAVLDPRVEEEMNDSGMIKNLINAALLCLNSNDESAGHQLSMSQVLAMVRGGKLP